MTKLTAAAGLVLLAGLSYAGGTEQYPYKTARVFGPVSDRPFDRGLRIDTRPHPPTEDHENPPLPFRPGIRGSNSLPVGQQQDLPRTMPAKVKWPAISATGWHPADNDIAVGPTNIVCSVNCDFAVFSRDGTKLGQKHLNDFFASVEKATFTFDPICFYDRANDRFFVCADCLDTTNKISQQLVAVSATADPMGAWFFYALESKKTDNNVDFWMDYPHYGHNKDAIALSGNMFSFDGSSYDGSSVITVPKAQMIAGQPATASYFAQPTIASIQFSRVYDKALPYIYGLAIQDGTTMSVLAIRNLTAAPVMDVTTVTIPFVQGPGQEAVAPAGHFLDTIDGRLFTCHFRNGHLVAAHNAQDPTTNRIDVRWYDISPGTWPAFGQPTLVQTGNISGGAQIDNHMPAITMNKKGSIGIAYTQSGENLPPRLVFAGRFKDDPPGVVGKPSIDSVSAGSTFGHPGSNRWGDYFGIDTDPLDDSTFYIFGMVGDSGTEWNTVVGHHGIDTTPYTSYAASVTKREGGIPSGQLSATYTDDGAYYSIPSVNVSQVGQVASAIWSFKTGPVVGTLEFSHLDADVLATDGATGFLFFYNWSTNSYEVFNTTPLRSAATAAKIQLTNTQLAKYTNTVTGEVRALYRAVYPQHLTVPAQPFMLRFDSFKLVREALLN